MWGGWRRAEVKLQICCMVVNRAIASCPGADCLTKVLKPLIFRSQPWRLKSRLGEQSPPPWTRTIKAVTREGGFCSLSCGFNRQSKKFC